MAVVGDVFGLNAVYDRQVKNVEENTIENWPELGISPQRGYLAGGKTSGPSATGTCLIQRMDYSSDTAVVISTKLSQTRDYFGNWITPSYAWFQGDWTSGLSSQERLDYSNETISQPGVNSPTSSGWGMFGTVQTPSYGYMAGGRGVSYRSKISRFDLSTESFLEKGNLPQYNAGLSGVYNSNYGYFGGGYYPPQAPDYICVINRLDFSSDTGASPITTSQSNRFHTSQFAKFKSTLQDSSYGYWAGGFDVSPPYWNDKISRFAFATETFGPPTTHPIGLGWKSLPSGRYQHSSASTSTHGYFVGGSTNTPPNYYPNNIEKMDFSTGTFTSPAGSAAVAVNAATLTNSVITNTSRSFGRPYGYRTAGYTKYYPGVNYMKYNFPSNTWSVLATGNPGYRSFGFNNNEYGYVSQEPANSIAKFDLSIESNVQTSIPYSNPTNNYADALSSKEYGFITGGFPSVSIARYDYSSDTSNLLSETLPLGRGAKATSYNQHYGYFTGGRSPDISNTQRLDFSTYATSTLPNSSNNPFGTSLFGKGNNCSNTDGYLYGGYNRSQLRRIDFSTEQNNFVTNLPATTREGWQYHGNYEGYFGGGYQPGIAAHKVEYSSHTISTIAPAPNPAFIGHSFSNGL